MFVLKNKFHLQQEATCRRKQCTLTNTRQTVALNKGPASHWANNQSFLRIIGWQIRFQGSLRPQAPPFWPRPCSGRLATTFWDLTGIQIKNSEVQVCVCVVVSGGAEPEHSGEDPTQHEGRPAVCSAELPDPRSELLRRVQPQVHSSVRNRYGGV